MGSQRFKDKFNREVASSNTDDNQVFKILAWSASMLTSPDGFRKVFDSAQDLMDISQHVLDELIVSWMNGRI